jgi:hypothetical protein
MSAPPDRLSPAAALLAIDWLLEASLGVIDPSWEDTREQPPIVSRLYALLDRAAGEALDAL